MRRERSAQYTDGLSYPLAGWYRSVYKPPPHIRWIRQRRHGAASPLAPIRLAVTSGSRSA